MPTLYDHIIKLGISPGYAQDMQDEFAGADTQAWLDGLRAMAELIRDETIQLVPPTAEPWQSVYAAVLARDPATSVADAITDAFEAWPAVSTPLNTTLYAVFLKLPPAGPARPGNRKTRWTASELMATSFPAPLWTVPNLIPVGLSILAGRPKVGKSWLGLQIAIAVAAGGVTLGQQAAQGPVLYLALEDGPRRLKERLATQYAGQATLPITFETEWKPFASGGFPDLRNELQAGGYSFVVIDTLARALGRVDQRDFALMTAVLGELQQLAQARQLAVMAIDHHRKTNGLAADPVDDIIESSAKPGVADTILGLYREKGKHSATLRARGREMEETELALEWDPLSCTWESLGAAGQVQTARFAGDIIDAIRDLTDLGVLATTANIATHLGKDRGYVSHTLAELIRKGRVVKAPKQGLEQPYKLNITP